MRKLTIIFQMFFKILLIFLVVLVWIRFFVRNLVYSIIISAVITAIIDLVTRYIFKRKETKLSQSIKEKEDAENMFTSLATNKASIDFFAKLIKGEVVKHKEYITYKKEDKKVVLYPVLSFCTLSINDVAQIMKKIKSEKADKVIISTGEIEKKCFSFINIYDNEIVLLDKFQTYEKLYKKSGIYPEITVKTKKDKKLTIKELIAYSFNRSRCKGYVISAFALLFCSLFVKATLYYTIVTSLLLVFAIISLANPFQEKTPPSNLI